MAALKLLRPMLLYGLICGALVLDAPPSGAFVAASPARGVEAGALPDGDARWGSETFFQHVHWERFCDWYSGHPLCLKLATLRQFCERHPEHRLCDDDDEDSFCRKHPYHHRCDDKPPSPS